MTKDRGKELKLKGEARMITAEEAREMADIKTRIDKEVARCLADIERLIKSEADRNGQLSVSVEIGHERAFGNRVLFQIHERIREALQERGFHVSGDVATRSFLIDWIKA
ncbi:MAG: hypothetical protein F4213_14865 [Boseongicola sp. SB0677_bin_26]|nr:hypothetical protein [Boseongicola sp. SB0677_bin_26]